MNDLPCQFFHQIVLFNLFIISVTAGSGDPGGGSMARVSPVAVRETVFSAEICSVDFPAAQHPGTILFDDIGNIRLHKS